MTDSGPVSVAVVSVMDCLDQQQGQRSQKESNIVSYWCLMVMGRKALDPLKRQKVPEVKFLIFESTLFYSMFNPEGDGESFTFSGFPSYKASV